MTHLDPAVIDEARQAVKKEVSRVLREVQAEHDQWEEEIQRDLNAISEKLDKCLESYRTISAVIQSIARPPNVATCWTDFEPLEPPFMLQPNLNPGLSHNDGPQFQPLDITWSAPRPGFETQAIILVCIWFVYFLLSVAVCILQLIRPRFTQFQLQFVSFTMLLSFAMLECFYCATRLPMIPK